MFIISFMSARNEVGICPSDCAIYAPHNSQHGIHMSSKFGNLDNFKLNSPYVYCFSLQFSTITWLFLDWKWVWEYISWYLYQIWKMLMKVFFFFFFFFFSLFGFVFFCLFLAKKYQNCSWKNSKKLEERKEKKNSLSYIGTCCKCNFNL